MPDPTLAERVRFCRSSWSTRALLQNLTLSASVGSGKDGYQGTSRDDKNTSAGLSATYLMNRNVGLSLNYSYFKRTSSGLIADKGPEFKVNKIGASLTVQY